GPYLSSTRSAVDFNRHRVRRVGLASPFVGEILMIGADADHRQKERENPHFQWTYAHCASSQRALGFKGREPREENCRRAVCALCSAKKAIRRSRLLCAARAKQNARGRYQSFG